MKTIWQKVRGETRCTYRPEAEHVFQNQEVEGAGTSAELTKNQRGGQKRTSSFEEKEKKRGKMDPTPVCLVWSGRLQDGSQARVSVERTTCMM